MQVGKGKSRLGPYLHPHNLRWKAVEGKPLPVQCDKDVARRDVTLCAVPDSNRGWIVPLAVESVDTFVLICMIT